MHWAIYSLIIAIAATFSIYLTKSLSTGSLSSAEITSTFIFIMGVICVVFSFKNIRLNVNENLWKIVLKAIAGIIIAFTIQSSADVGVNLGLITSLSVAIYIPLVTLSLYLAYNEALTKKQILGLFVSRIGIYLILST